MPRLSDTQRSVLADWWTLAYDAGFGSYTATDLNNAAKQIAADAGVTLSFAEYTALSVLYGYANRMSHAADELQSALDDAIIGPEHMATPPWARDESVMNSVPIRHVIFEFTYTDQSGVTQTDYRTSVFEMTFPDTVGDLKDAITEDAQAMADKYKVTFESVNLLQILEV